MNKSAIRNFAIWARVQLIEAAKQSLALEDTIRDVFLAIVGNLL